MELEGAVLERVRTYESLSRWERSEIGRDLRRFGLSYGEIMNLIPVKKSTLATWCRDIELSDEQVEMIKVRTGENARTPDTQWRRRREVALIKARALREAEQLVEDPLWVAGVALYWGEGFKTQNRLGMAMADPFGLRLFLKWVNVFHKPEAGFRARINLHSDNDELAARRFWAQELGLTMSGFTKSYVKPNGTGHRKNHLEFGVCAVRMRKCANAFHATSAWIEFLQARFGR